MTTIPTADVAAASDGEKLLAEVQASLTEQISLAKGGQMKEVSLLTESLAELLSRASRCASLPSDGKAANRIRQLYSELCLILATEKDDLGRKLRKTSAGKKSLGRYRDALTGGAKG